MKKYILIAVVGVFLLSCKTYTISPQSFKEQFASSDSTSLQSVAVNNPLFFSTIKYQANRLTIIKAVDKKGNNVTLQNSPSIEMRVTLKSGKRYIMYFDTAVLQNDILYGNGARLIGGVNRKIPFSDIEKIEVQDGGKNYTYK